MILQNVPHLIYRWFVKLSKGGAGLSRPLKRYFVLRGRSLLCYRSEPVKAHSLALGASGKPPANAID